jgi:replicative DNA helicase
MAMIDNGVLPEVMSILEYYRWTSPPRASIYTAMHLLYEEGKPVDSVTVCERLALWVYGTDTNELERVGGPVEICTLVGEVSTSSSAGRYARMLVDRENDE